MVGSCAETMGDEDDELSDEEVALDVGKDEGNVDLDDADASDLDIGLHLPEPGESGDDANTRVDLDFSDLFARENDVTEAGDDESGPRDFDASTGIGAIVSEDLSDDALGLEGVELVLEAGTPLAGSEGDEEGAIETLDLFIADETEPLPAAQPWGHGQAIPGEFEAISCLGAHVLAAGSEAWLGSGDRGAPLALGAVTSAVLLGSPEAPTLLASTKLGDLLQWEPSQQATPRPVDWKAALGLDSSSPATLRLCRVDTSQQCLALSSTGRLLSTTRSGMRQLKVPARPIALPSSSDTPLVLGETERGLCLLRAQGPTLDWTIQMLPELVSRVFRGNNVELAACESVVALANRQEGAFVSSDGGRRFTPIAGTAASVAVACGRCRGALSVWVVVSHEVRGESDLLRIDPELQSASRLARFATRDPREDAFAPVAGLAFEPRTETLYAVGAFGLLRFSRSDTE